MTEIQLQVSDVLQDQSVEYLVEGTRMEEFFGMEQNWYQQGYRGEDMDKEMLKALEEVLDYLWKDEETSYEEWLSDDAYDPDRHHIFESLKVLQNYLDDHKED